MFGSLFPVCGYNDFGFTVKYAGIFRGAPSFQGWTCQMAAVFLRFLKEGFITFHHNGNRTSFILSECTEYFVPAVNNRFLVDFDVGGNHIKILLPAHPFYASPCRFFSVKAILPGVRIFGIGTPPAFALETPRLLVFGETAMKFAATIGVAALFVRQMGQTGRKKLHGGRGGQAQYPRGMLRGRQEQGGCFQYFPTGHFRKFCESKITSSRIEKAGKSYVVVQHFAKI